MRLADGLDQIADLTSADGMKLYCNALRAENAYLGGQSYQLVGGGALAPVPEPDTGALVLLGLVGLGWQRRRCAASRSRA